jgi:phenylalanine-4-hydroxylase
LKRVLRTPYKIDDYQSAYFVVESFTQLFEATAPDFSPLYAEISELPSLPLDATMHGEKTYPPNIGKFVVA